MSDILYLVRRRNLTMEGEKLEYGKIYPSEKFATVPSRMILAMLSIRYLMRGTADEMEAEQAELLGQTKKTAKSKATSKAKAMAAAK